jgi:putative transposase
MSLKYKITEGRVYFVTLTVIGWVDVFTRKNHKLTIIDSLKYCQKHKGLELYAYCLMSSHLHMIVAGKDNCHLSDILRDFKKYTSKAIIKQILEEPESRKDWMLNRFEYAGKLNSKIKNYQFWQEGNHAKEVYGESFTRQKLEYIHNNPIAEMIVTKPEDYIFSSARNYADMDSVIDVIRINIGLSRSY